MNITAKLASGAVIGSLMLASAGVAFAQNTMDPAGTYGNAPSVNSTTGTGTTGTTSTSGTTGTTGTIGTPGVPNTGVGGDLATNLALLATTGILAVGSGIYLSRQKFLPR